MPTTEFVEVHDPAAFDGVGCRYFVGRRFCYWQDGTRALGTMMWGRPEESDIAAMIPFFEIGADPRFAGHASFVDGRSIEAIDVLAFDDLLRYLVARRSAWGPHIRRQAILHPGGFVGVVVSGALHVARPPYPFRCFSTDAARQAFEWNGVPEHFDALEALRGSLCESPDVVRGVRALLLEGGALSTSAIAKALSLSTRTLQRRLGAAGTSLRAERQRHVSEQIEELLAGTDLDLDAIAAKVGLASASHVVRHFQGTHGETPGAYRERLRSRGGSD